ncbi:MAG: dTDP-4-dehydrorhamnose reductase [Candidatus Latescibacteria bacterium]|nr:dTDP-4-dehydrorhamnose reductase [Gemmatimonadaceae bacterium]MDP6014925.1 dTDP-4-dehydrorhamnose reductase [Candidatus Latescibacterota bacterium]MDP7447706.1 dTDP-4-dehydrorhamnose reductase [Candidatus Latescibacterota bacterium]HJP33200.1 dTDP-4-dehydrorhamnose reductase [Candidatus Latescibacterota bacterium]
MKLLVTGAHGLLGRALLQADWGADVKRVGCGRHADPVGDVSCHAVDLTDADAVVELWRQLRPDRVIHTAALTDVDLCETEPELARRVNRDVVAHVVAASAEVGAGVAHLSTDYVFDGQGGPYSEQDSPRPLSVYGRMKLESEALVLDAGVEGLVVRTLWLYGHLRSVRPNLVTWPLEALARGESMRIVADQWGNPTYVHDLARALVELSRRGVAGLFHMGGSTFLTREELVRHVAGHFHLDTSHVEVITTARAGQAAPRPLRSGLRTDAIEAELGWTPASLSEGLERMAADTVFRQDFAHLVDPEP